MMIIPTWGVELASGRYKTAFTPPPSGMYSGWLCANTDCVDPRHAAYRATAPNNIGNELKYFCRILPPSKNVRYALRATPARCPILFLLAIDIRIAIDFQLALDT